MASPTTRTASESSFEDATESFIDWFRLHSSKVIGGMAAVVVAGGLYMGYRAYSTGQETRAERAYFDAQAAAAGDRGVAEQQLRQVATRYDGTAGGAQAQLTLAQILFEQGKYQEGMDVLKQADDAPDALEPAVRVLRAAGEEGLGRPAEAAKLYAAAAADEKSEGRKAELLANAARAYQQAGQPEPARKIWADLAAKDENPLADEARVRLGELTAQAAKN